MPFDIVLPSVISVAILAMIWLHAKFEMKIKPLLGDKKFKIRDAIFLVAAMGVMVVIVVLVPTLAIQVLFLMAYSFVLFLFTYILSNKWYIALLPPVAFVVLYVYFWDIFLLNLFALIFAILVSIYLGSMFSWITVSIFAGLITVMDIFQVFVTRFMGASAEKLLELKLPIAIQVPTFPNEGTIFTLGLGDIFLAGLLSIQTAQKYNRKAGFVAALSIGVAFLIFEAIVLHTGFRDYFPATIVVVCGWLLGLGLTLIFKEKKAK